MNQSLIDVVTGGGQFVALVVNAFNLSLLLLGLGLLWLHETRELLPNAKELGAARTGILDAGSREEVLALRPRLRAVGILARRLDRLRRTAERGGEVDHGGIAATTVAELDSALALPRHLVSVPVLIGLFGTLVGLNRTVGSAHGMLSGPSPDLTRLSALFDGLGLAFSATLIGVFCTVVMGVAVTMVRRDQTRYLIDLEDLTAGCILPYFQPSPSTAMAQSAAALTAMQRDLQGELRRLVNELSTSGATLKDIVTKEMGALVVTVQQRGIALTNTLDASMSVLHSESKALLTEYQAAHRGIQDLLGVAPGEQRPLVESLTLLREATQSASQAASSMRLLVPSLTEALERQADRQSVDIHEALNEYVSRVATALDEHGATLTRTEARTAEQTSGAIAESLSMLSAPAEALRQSHAHSLDIVRALTAALTTFERESSGLAVVVESLRLRDEASKPPVTPHEPESISGKGPRSPSVEPSQASQPSQATSKQSLFQKFFGGGR